MTSWRQTYLAQQALSQVAGIAEVLGSSARTAGAILAEVVGTLVGSSRRRRLRRGRIGQTRPRRARPRSGGGHRTSTASGVLWLAGGIAPGPVRVALWAAAVVVEYAAAMSGFYTPGLGRSTTADWPISGGHLAEGCQLFLIIALGESILITAAVFGTLPPGVAAVGDELTVSHPGGHADAATIVSVLGGPALFLAGHALFKRAVFGRLSTPRVVAMGVLGALVPVGLVVAPLALSAMATLTVAAVAGWDAYILRRAPPATVD